MQGDPPGRQIDRAIGASLRELRQSRKQSARRLAEQSGISAAMVSRIENGLVSPSIDTLAALAETLEVPIVSLFSEARTDHHRLYPCAPWRRLEINPAGGWAQP